MKSNRNGFTLIEIIVSIAIGSIVLMILGQIILSSSLFLDRTTQTDEYKRKTDEIVSFIREEVQYATDVRFVKEDSRFAPDYENDSEWHYFYVKDGVLFRDGKKLFSDGYYGDQTISVYVKGYKDNNHRMDIKYSLLDYNKEGLYSSRDTIMFLNLSLSDDIAENAFITNNNEYELSNNGYWLFYTKKVRKVDSGGEVTDGKDGTVADIRYTINGYNYGGIYDPSNPSKYTYDEYGNVIVWYNGYWWQRIYNQDNNKAPGEGTGWKCLSRYYTNPNTPETAKLCSVYQRNDIVIYKDDYYRVIKDVTYIGSNQYQAFITNPEFFTNLGSINDPKVIEVVKQNTYQEKNAFSRETVASKYLPKGLDFSDPAYPQISFFDEQKVYQKGDIIKVKVNNDEKYCDLYVKNGGLEGKLAPGTPKSGWTKISPYYDYTRGKKPFACNSFYLKGDVVINTDAGNKPYIQAQQDVIENIDATDDMNKDGVYWKII